MEAKTDTEQERRKIKELYEMKKWANRIVEELSNEMDSRRRLEKAVKI